MLHIPKYILNKFYESPQLFFEIPELIDKPPDQVYKQFYPQIYIQGIIMPSDRAPQYCLEAAGKEIQDYLYTILYTSILPPFEEVIKTYFSDNSIKGFGDINTYVSLMSGYDSDPHLLFRYIIQFNTGGKLEKIISLLVLARGKLLSNQELRGLLNRVVQYEQEQLRIPSVFSAQQEKLIKLKQPSLF